MTAFVVVGPSDRTVVQGRLGERYHEWLKHLAVVSKTHFDELYFMPDHGVYVDFALEFQAAGGKITAVIPSEDKEFIEMASRYTPHFRAFDNATGWSYLNTHLVSLGTTVLCIGYSAGSLLEIASIKYAEKYGSVSIPLYVDTRACIMTLPFELERELSSVSYFDSSRAYHDLLAVHMKEPQS